MRVTGPLSGRKPHRMPSRSSRVKRDYYEVLGVGRDADQLEIKRAFRRLAMACHPDVKPSDPGCEARFKEGAEAYGVLSDPRRRAAYDREGFDGLSGFSMPEVTDVPADALFTALFGPCAFGIPLHPYAAMRIAAELRRNQEKRTETSSAGAEALEHPGSASGRCRAAGGNRVPRESLCR